MLKRSNLVPLRDIIDNTNGGTEDRAPWSDWLGGTGGPQRQAGRSSVSTDPSYLGACLRICSHAQGWDKLEAIIGLTVLSSATSLLLRAFG
ncbi:hypothetical protein [Sneathiella sp.]|uniref:hypothetical protein n=1 Tax=Sneathiella sp. TaxID=1964365 RepID=UPI00356160A7